MFALRLMLADLVGDVCVRVGVCVFVCVCVCVCVRDCDCDCLSACACKYALECVYVTGVMGATGGSGGKNTWLNEETVAVFIGEML
jgi:hypothetical protein